MFNLDHAVEKWRSQMFAAGIRKSTSLDELESHLRDHITRLTREGNGVEEAFNAAVQKIGQIDVLQKEFAKTEGFSRWLEHVTSRGSQRILAVLWMASSCWLLLTYALLRFIWRISPTFVWLDVLVVLAAMCGIIGSVLLSTGSDWGRRIVRILGFFMAAVCIAQVFFLIPRWLEGGPIAGQAIIVRGALTMFGLITVALLRSAPQPHARPKARIEQASVARAIYASPRVETVLVDVNTDHHYRSTVHVIHQQVLRGAVICLLAAVLLVVLGGPWFWMHRMRTLQDTSFAQDPRFVVTKLPLTGVRNPSFDPGPRAICSIYGFLNQCTEVSGVRYILPKEVAAGEIEFGGYTNTMTAREFVQAFTDALQYDRPQWIDFRTQTHYRENLVLLTNDARTVLVLPRAMVKEFEKRRAN